MRCRSDSPRAPMERAGSAGNGRISWYHSRMGGAIPSAARLIEGMFSMSTAAGLRERYVLYVRLLAHWRQWCFGIGLVLAIFLVNQPAWQGGPLWDDDAHMTRRGLQSRNGLYRIWFDL